MLLKRVTVNVGQIVYSPNHKAFVAMTTDNYSKENLFLAVEEYVDLTGTYFAWLYFILKEFIKEKICIQEQIRLTSVSTN